jgi:RNA polymerase sigma-70 factor (ECF subfamily)
MVAMLTRSRGGRDSSAFKSDVDLTRAAAGGDRRARRIMAERLLDRVRTTVRYISADDRDQDDWVQIAMIEILRSARTFQASGSLESWADRIAIRSAMRHLKRRRRKESVVELDEDPRYEPVVNPSEGHTRMAVRRQVARLLGTISDKRRTCVVLRLVYGYSIDEIAEMTAAPRNTVRDRLKRGRKQLKEKVRRDPLLKEWVNSRTI